LALNSTTKQAQIESDNARNSVNNEPSLTYFNKTNIHISGVQRKIS